MIDSLAQAVDGGVQVIALAAHLLDADGELLGLFIGAQVDGTETVARQAGLIEPAFDVGGAERIDLVIADPARQRLGGIAGRVLQAFGGFGEAFARGVQGGLGGRAPLAGAPAARPPSARPVLPARLRRDPAFPPADQPGPTAHQGDWCVAIALHPGQVENLQQRADM